MRTPTPEQVAIERARTQFTAEVDTHQMSVLLDQSTQGQPYRHVRFSAPGTSIWRFDLVTWPGHLAISGDLESFTFRRTHDMFDFFRCGGINAGYWAEKVIAGNPRARFCFDSFSAQVTDYVDEAIESEYGMYPEAEVEALRDAVHAELLEEEPTHLEDAQVVLDRFMYTFKDGEVFTFADTWEWDLGGYNHHFLLGLHAIAYGVRTYLAAHPDNLVVG